jgi:hypothetical protein
MGEYLFFMEFERITLDELEKKRQDLFKKAGPANILGWLLTIVGVGIFAVAFLTLAAAAIEGDGTVSDSGLVAGNLLFMLFSVVLIVFGALMKAAWKQKYAEFNKIFKNNVVLAIISEKMDVISYTPDSDMKKEEMDKSNLFREYNVHYGNDLLEAKYKNTHFRMCDTKHIYQYTTYDENDKPTTHNIDRFKGRLMIIDYDAFCDTPVFVCEHTIDKLNKSSPYSLDDSEVTMLSTESPEFDKMFYVKCESQTDALRILTPQVINGILDVRKKLDMYIKNIRFAYKDDKLYITLYSEKDFMEAAEMSGITVTEQYEFMKKEVNVITDLLDLLYLREIKSGKAK